MTDLPSEGLVPEEVPDEGDAPTDPEEYQPEAPASAETGTVYEPTGQPESTPEDDTDEDES